VCCSVLQCVAVCCSVLQCFPLETDVYFLESQGVVQIEVRCSVLQCDAVRCSALQCIAVCCSVLPSTHVDR